MNVEIYKLGASLDSSNNVQEQENILAIFDKGNSIILDMTACTYVSSAGLRVLLYSYKVANSKGLKLYLVGVCDEVRDVMNMTGFEKYFDIFNTVEECQKSVEG